ncbi:amidohydrolase family protein [Microbacterium paulum]
MMASASRPVEFTASDLAEAVAFAHQLGMRTAIHANFSETSVLAAARAGCTTIEHGYAITDDALRALADFETALCPTLTALHSVADNREIAEMRVGTELAAQAAANLDRARESVRRYSEAGVPIVAGTDAGVMGALYGDIHTELKLLRQCGLSALEALQAATAAAADALGEPLGVVEPGRKADLLVVRRNPLTDLDTLRAPEAIILEGQLIEPVE